MNEATKNTLTMDYDVLSKLIKDASVFTAKTDVRPILQLARVCVEVNTMRIEALDGYRVIRIKAGIEYDGEPFAFYIKPSVFPKGKFDFVEVTYKQIRCVHEYLGGQAIFTVEHPHIDADWVNLDMIYPDYKNQKETAKRVGFNVDFLAKLAPIVGKIQHRLVQMYFPASEKSPFVLTAKSECNKIHYEFLILPVHIRE